jgi:RNA polymerase sigma-70 factor (ECF subfamily)
VTSERDRRLAYLLGRVARGDAAAYGELYDEVAPAVFGLARRMLGDRSAAEELVQEVLVETWRTSARFDSDRGSVMTWVLTLAHRRAVDRLRRSRVASERDERLRLVNTRLGDDPSDRAMLADAQAAVREALAALPMPQREALVLAFFGGYSHPEVAARLGVPLGTVKTRIRQGMLRLRERLEEHQ